MPLAQQAFAAALAAAGIDAERVDRLVVAGTHGRANKAAAKKVPATKAASKTVKKAPAKKAAKKVATKKAYVSPHPEPAEPLITAAKVELGKKRIIKKPARDEAPF